MHKPRFLDQLAMDLGDREAFTVAFARGRRAFQPQHVEAKWARDRAANINHIKLEVALDFDAKKISGTATHRLSAITGPLDRLEFDAAELDIKAVRAGREPATFETSDGKLRIALPRALDAGEEIEIAIDYAGQPRRGLYFVGPDDAYPNKPRQAWTQGEDEDSRYWFPCYDYPNNRTTSEVIATVPEKFTAVSNGALIGTTSNAAAKTRTFHWRHDVPHFVYLMTLAAGEFALIEERAGNTPVTYYVAPGREDDARRAFGNTPKMIQFFERVIGVPYPYAKYAQVAVSDFIFGGMENTSATTQTDSTLHDARAHLDFKSDPLVAHELAHQWWGDLLTCRDWAHAWLNEGFATYFEALWCEENLGADEFAWNVRQDREAYLDEDANHYRRPDRLQPLSHADRFVRSPSLREGQPGAAHAAARDRRRAVLQIAQPLLHAASRRQRHHAGPAARVRGHDRPQPRFFLRPVGVQGRASRNRSLEFVRRQEKTAQRHRQADAQDRRHDRVRVHVFP